MCSKFCHIVHDARCTFGNFCFEEVKKKRSRQSVLLKSFVRRFMTPVCVLLLSFKPCSKRSVCPGLVLRLAPR